MTPPVCNSFMHAYRGIFGVFRKGSLCLCGRSVLDRQVTAGLSISGERSNWLMASGWRALLEDA